MPKVNWIATDVGTIADLLTHEECDANIKFSENRRFEEAPVSTHAGMVMMKDVRNNDRVMVDDMARAQDLYDRIADSVPPRVDKKWRPAGLNERLRFYRCDVGQKFDWHSDGYFERENGDKSFLTFMVYLNEDFDGGGTSFRDNGFGREKFAPFTVLPKKGMGLIFRHPISHRGDSVIAGRKYVIRSDVMYTRIARPVAV